MANLNKWTGFYVDLALKVATYRENVRRQELINIVENLYKETHIKGLKLLKKFA